MEHTTLRRTLPMLLAMAALAAPIAPASADPPPWSHGRGHNHDRGHSDRGRHDDHRDERRAYVSGYRDGSRSGYYNGRKDDRRTVYYRDGRPYYYDGGRYYASRPRTEYVRYHDYRWGPNGRVYCRRNDGTTGLVVGALAGGTLGNVLAQSGDKVLGSVIGGTLGAIIGKEIDKGNAYCR